LDDVVFHVASTAYSWEDVLDWGRRQEGWGEHEREVREGVAALEHVRRRGEPLDHEVAAAAAAFRRAHRLISAEDTERWLAQRHLSVGVWKDHIRRTVARQRHPDPPPDSASDGTAEDETARRWATGVCSGFYATLAAGLAERVATAEAQAELTGAVGAGGEHEGDRWEALETAYTTFRRSAATDRAVAEEIIARRLDWIDFELEWVSFPHEAAAREALLCLREDGDFSAAVSAGQAAVPGRRRAQLCDFEPELRTSLLGAQVGDALGPARTPDGWRVIRVVARSVPAAGDEEVQRLAVAAVQTRAVRREVERRVRWRERH
jgi:hypothetical protein